MPLRSEFCSWVNTLIFVRAPLNSITVQQFEVQAFLMVLYQQALSHMKFPVIFRSVLYLVLNFSNALLTPCGKCFEKVSWTLLFQLVLTLFDVENLGWVLWYVSRKTSRMDKMVHKWTQLFSRVQKGNRPRTLRIGFTPLCDLSRNSRHFLNQSNS